MRRPALLACLTIALAIPTFSGVARADDAATVEAQARFQEGLDLADAGKHEPARLKFQQAWSVFKSPAVLYNLARSEQLTGHELEALEHFRLFLRVGATDVKITDAMRDKAKQNAAELARKVGQVEIEVPASARVTVDGKPLEETPKDPVPVQPGRHTIEATFDGKVRNVSVECLAGNVVKARIDFDTPGGSTEPPREDARGFWTTGRYVGLTTALVGLGAVGAGVVFGLSASTKHDDANAKRATLPDQNSSCSTTPSLPQCADLKGLESDYKSASTLSTVFLVSGGALFVGGAVLFLVASPRRAGEPPTQGSRIIPMASAHEAGISWMGTF
jgi:hypothetical protein